MIMGGNRNGKNRKTKPLQCGCEDLALHVRGQQSGLVPMGLHQHPRHCYAQRQTWSHSDSQRQPWSLKVTQGWPASAAAFRREEVSGNIQERLTPKRLDFPLGRDPLREIVEPSLGWQGSGTNEEK